jgi:TrmH family RNA methyltransferase
MPPLVVLVRTHNPGNLGGAARAAKNFGAEIVLLEPRAAADHPDAVAFASGAEDLLRRMETLATWDALGGRVDSIVALTSLRGRQVRGLPPRLTWSGARSLLAGGRRVALAFGPERGGLTTQELRGCDGRLTIPTRSEFPTLNLAQSVAASLALLSAFPAPRSGRGAWPEEAIAPSKDVRRLLASFTSTLAASGYPGRGHSKEVVAELESFLTRGRPTAREVTLFLGALAAIGRALGVSSLEPRARTGARPTGTPRPAR